MGKKSILLISVILFFVSCQTVPTRISNPVLDLLPADGVVYMTIKANELPSSDLLSKVFLEIFPDMSKRQLQLLRNTNYFIASFNTADFKDVSVLVTGKLPSVADFIANEEEQGWVEEAGTWQNAVSTIFISEPAPGVYFVRTHPDELRESTTQEQKERLRRELDLMHKSSMSFSLYDMAALASISSGYSKAPFRALTIGATFVNNRYATKVAFTFANEADAKDQMLFCKLFVLVFFKIVVPSQDITKIIDAGKWETDAQGNVTCTLLLSKDYVESALATIALLGATK